MQDKRDLGKLIKQRLANAEAEPANDLWDAIEKTLERKRKRRAGFIWLWGGLGTLLGILLFFYFTSNPAPADVDSMLQRTPPKAKETPLFDSQKNTEHGEHKALKNKTEVTVAGDSLTEKTIRTATKTTSDTQVNRGSESNRNKTETQATKKQTSPNENGPMDVAFSKNNEKSKSQLPSKLSSQTTLPEKAGASTPAPIQKIKNENTLANSKASKTVDSIPIAPKEVNKDSIPIKAALPKKPKKEEEEKVKKILDPSKWLFSAQFAPNYYDYLSKGNPFEQSLNTGKTQGNSSLSYGILINMPISDKLTFRLGYRKSNFKITVKDAISSQDAAGNSLIFRDVAILRKAVPIPTSISDSINNGRKFDITQKMSYSEIPFELYYTLLKGKISVDVIGGLNPLLLGNNSVHISNSSGSVTLGSGRYLKKVAIAPTIGLGLRYQFNKKIRIDLEPVLRYHSNVFDNDYKNRRPYSLGIRTGLTLKL